ncbi:MAG: hypothetical protein EOO39_11720 [Cytophagaceae bacterium]|nr:MAG: hypothetical protein EOO39_11720 [Cytophagaceae bacterium]
MLTAIEGIYENGRVILTETPPTKRRVKVYITFTNEEVEATPQNQKMDMSYMVGSLSHLTPAQNANIDRELNELRDSWERDTY